MHTMAFLMFCGRPHGSFNCSKVLCTFVDFLTMSSSEAHASRNHSFFYYQFTRFMDAYYVGDDTSCIVVTNQGITYHNPGTDRDLFIVCFLVSSSLTLRNYFAYFMHTYLCFKVL